MGVATAFQPWLVQAARKKKQSRKVTTFTFF